MSDPTTPISVNRSAAPLVAALIASANELRIDCTRDDSGAMIIDAGVEQVGGLAAGVAIARICMAGLGAISLTPAGDCSAWPWSVHVSTSQPTLACLGSQYAGWSVKCEQTGSSYSAMASGPGRALASIEPLFEEIGYRDSHDSAVLILEHDALPPVQLSRIIADRCGLPCERLTLIVTPTGSLAGGTQIAARVVEVGLHKAHELGFPLQRIVDAQGTAPLPPPAPDILTAMGRTNDAILYGGCVQLMVTGTDADAGELANALPSCNSRDYGRPFSETFAACNYDFFQIDGSLFSPARVWVTALESGKSFTAGKTDLALLQRSFGFA